MFNESGRVRVRGKRISRTDDNVGTSAGIVDESVDGTDGGEGKRVMVTDSGRSGGVRDCLQEICMTQSDQSIKMNLIH